MFSPTRARRLYRAIGDFMDQEDTPYIASLFRRGSPVDSRIVGDRLYVAKAKRWAAQPRRVPSEEQLVCAVAHILGKAPADIRAPGPRRRSGSRISWMVRIARGVCVARRRRTMVLRDGVPLFEQRSVVIVRRSLHASFSTERLNHLLGHKHCNVAIPAWGRGRLVGLWAGALSCPRHSCSQDVPSVLS